MELMSTGTIKWFDNAKKYGFIVSEQGPEFYVHGSALTPGSFPRAGDIVEFRVEDTDRGVQAVQVTVTEPAAQASTENSSSGAEADLLDLVDKCSRRLAAVATTLRQGKVLGGESAFYAAREMRRLAARLNPPAS